MLRTLRTPLLAAAVTLLWAGNAHAVGLEINGGFETGDFTGWTQFPGGGTQSVTNVNPSAGVWAANLNASGGAPIDNLIKNANIGIGVVNPGDEITITFDARGSTANGGVAFAEVFSEIAGGGVSASVILGGAPLALDGNPDVWTTYAFTTLAGPDVSGGITLQLKAGCGAVAGCESDIYFDNVSVSVVPIPAAVWLFASALGLLGSIRRRGA